jgi:hypothetical protein
MDPNGHDDPIRHPAGLAQDVQVAIGDGIEAAGVERGSGHAPKA